jgi:flagellar biosynthetic protein FlhB
MTMVLWPERHRLEIVPGHARSVAAILGVHHQPDALQMLGFGGGDAWPSVAIADFFFQYRQWFERQKMSLQEIKEEFKQSEGDPHDQGARSAAVRASTRMKQAHDGGRTRRQRSIITNPTHYAVALSSTTAA